MQRSPSLAEWSHTGMDVCTDTASARLLSEDWLIAPLPYALAPYSPSHYRNGQSKILAGA